MKRKKYIDTLIAIIILLALWGGITLWQKRKNKASSKKQSTSEKLLSVKSSHITSFTLEPEGGKAVTCQRENGKWVIVKPNKLPADQSAVSGFLTSLTDATVNEVVNEHPTNLKDYGLERPSEIIDVSTNAKPAKFTLRLGDETPTGEGVYAQVASAPRVITLASYLKSSLSKTPFDFRDKRAVTLNEDQIEKIQVESKGESWTLAKNPEGVWDLVLPPAVRADHFSVETLVDALHSASMQSVVSNDKRNLARYGLGSPTLRIKLTGNGASQTLVLGSKAKEADRYYAMNSALDPIFTLGSNFLTQFQKDPSDLREKNLFSYSSFNVKRLEVTTPKEHEVFEQQKGKWQQTVPASKKIPENKMDSFLDQLRDLRANSFPKQRNLSALGLTKPAYTFKVQFGEKNQTETVELSKVGKHVYARRSTDSLASELPANSIDNLEKKLKGL